MDLQQDLQIGKKMIKKSFLNMNLQQNRQNGKKSGQKKLLQHQNMFMIQSTVLQAGFLKLNDSQKWTDFGGGRVAAADSLSYILNPTLVQSSPQSDETGVSGSGECRS
jgi:hypothetical protein